MTKTESATFNMFCEVGDVCNKNTPIVAIIPAFKNAADGLAIKVVAIRAASQEQLQRTNGNRTEKGAQKEALARLTSNVAGGVLAYAAVKKNKKLMEAVNITYSELLRFRDDQFPQVCMNIYEEASSRAADLVDYGLTDTTIDAVKTAVENFRDESPSPRSARVRKKTARATIKKLLQEGKDLLTLQMDTLVMLLPADHSEFVKDYKNARKLVPLPMVHTQLKGLFENKKTGEPISGGTFEIVEISKTMQTDANGEFESGKVVNGKFAGRASAPGFHNKDIAQLHVKRGKITHVNVSLEPLD